MRRKNDMNLWWGMWWIAVAIFFLGIVCLLTGCKVKAEEANRFTMTLIEDTDVGRFSVIEDTETGDRYLYMARAGGYSGMALMPQPVEEVTFTGEEAKVFQSALPAENHFPEAAEMMNETIPEAYDAVTDEPKLESIGTFTVTAYCPCTSCSDAWGDMTATGVRAVEGRTIAVDPDVLPYGTTVYFDGIDGFGGYVAEDCGGAIDGKDIDIYFDTHEEAEAWGVKEREVFVMKEAA